jgi:hypothetical protein
MAGTADCLRILAQRAGRALSDDEVSQIFERIHKAALDIKNGKVQQGDLLAGPRTDVGKAFGNQAEDVVTAAAREAAAQMVRDAENVERRANLQMARLSAVDTMYAELKQKGMAPMEAIYKIIFRNYRKTNIESMEQHIRGVKDLLDSKLLATWDAQGDRFLGLFADKEAQLDLIRELHQQDTGNAAAKEGAKAYLEVAEYARQWFNRVGGDIAKLENYAHPQAHSQALVSRAVEELGGAATTDTAANKTAWLDFITKLVDERVYVNSIGQQMSQAEIRDFIGHAFETISTNGIANITPGKVTGIGSMANRHAEHRSIHFKDAESAILYWDKFTGKSVPEVLHDHIALMARDIAMVEFMGPNDMLTWHTMRDQALQESVLADRQNEPKLRERAAKMDRWYMHATGRMAGSANHEFSGFMDGVSHLNTAAKGGGFALASLFGDRVLYQAVAHLNNIPLFQDWSTQLKLLSPTNGADRRVLQRNGMMLESLQTGFNRFWDDFGTSGSFANTTSKWANAVMKVTGMTDINNIPKGAFELGLGAAIGHEIQAGRDFTTLHKSDVRTLRNYGITEVDWATWKLAALEDMGGGNTHVLLPEAIGRITDDQLRQAHIIGQADGAVEAETARRNATVKLLGAINTEAEFAIVTPGMRERAQMYSGLQRGTPFGEIGRAVLQFKSFPWAMFQRGLDLVGNANSGMGKMGWGAYLILGTTLAGAMIAQTRDVLSGKDPQDMFRGNWGWLKFWGKSVLQGGALGIYGDFFYSANQTRYGSGLLEAMAGPTVGPIIEAGRAPLDAIRAQMEGKESHLGATELRTLKGFVPGSNLWYAKTALDHLIWMQAMEATSPGYLGNIRAKTAKEYGQDWWMTPRSRQWWNDASEALPERAPNLPAAVGH